MDEPFPQSPGNTPPAAPAGPGGSAPGPTQGQVGGSRHYQGPTLGQLIMWKCPQCGAENTGNLSDGCSTCGSGSAKPYHVASPPPTARKIEYPNDMQEVPGFDDWLETCDLGAATVRLRPILLEAWQAAIRWYTRTPAVEVGEQPTVRTVLVPIALIRKVIETLEQVFDLPEDQQSPELITLIAELKELAE